MERDVDRSTTHNKRQNFLLQQPPADGVPLHQTLAPSVPGEEIPPSINDNVKKEVGSLNSFFHRSL